MDLKLGIIIYTEATDEAVDLLNNLGYHYGGITKEHMSIDGFKELIKQPRVNCIVVSTKTKSYRGGQLGTGYHKMLISDLVAMHMLPTEEAVFAYLKANHIYFNPRKRRP